MKRKFARFELPIRIMRSLVAVVCTLLLVPGDMSALGSQAAPDKDAAAAAIPPAQLDALVAPIALYPDPLLSQTLVASTYPLEIIQLQQWLSQNKGLKDKALTDAVQKQDWDPSIQAMAALPDVVKRLADDVKWTTDLGNAFLAQQSDVMDAVQRMRKKAKDTGNLKSTEQQKVEVQTVESKQIIIVQPASPEVIYVPSYNPTVVYGPPVYPYPPIYYPPPPPPGAYVAGVAVAFGVGMMVGAAYHGGWGYGCGWGHNDVNINVNNNYVNHSNQNINNINRSGSGNGTWQHNPQHRGGTPYANKATANKYGGTARGDSMSSRQSNARQNQARQQGSANNRAGSQTGSGNRGNSASAGSMDRSSGNRGSSPSAGSMDRSAGRSSGGGGDKVGNRSVSNSSGGGAFGGGGSGNSARASSSRGSSSMGGSRGGGGRR